MYLNLRSKTKELFQKLFILCSLSLKGKYLTTSFILTSILFPLACTPVLDSTEDGRPIYESDEGTFVWQKYELDNARFEPQLPNPIHIARTYWLKRGEVIAPRWDTFEMQYQKEGEVCSFTNNATSQNCIVCEFCSLSPNLECPGESLVVLGGDYMKIVSDDGFSISDNSKTLLTYEYFIASSVSPVANCTQAVTNKPEFSFAPDQSGLFRITDKLFPDHIPDRSNISGNLNGEVKVQVVDPGADAAQKTAYPLRKRLIDGRNYWAWEDAGDPIWKENFSSDLRVTDVSIFRGVCADGTSDGKECKVPSERVPVKASRILFLPVFQQTVSGHQSESQHRCYSETANNNGSFMNLDRCRERNDSTRGTSKFATPTYVFSPAAFDEKLTWLVEFNTNEGADADLSTPANDPMDSRPNLIIEFTIEAR